MGLSQEKQNECEPYPVTQIVFPTALMLLILVGSGLHENLPNFFFCMKKNII
jgi:hypothetical protein